MPSKIFQPGLLEGQVAIVTGGGSGLGRAAALELAELRARVVVCGRRADPLEETAARSDGGRVEARVCDIREEDQVEALVGGPLRDRHGQDQVPEAGRRGGGRDRPARTARDRGGVAWLVAYLATPAGDYFSGAVLTLDGARDNWYGTWPPGGLVDAGGRPLPEERRPQP